MRLAGSRPWCTIRQDPLVLVAHGSEERAGPSSSRDFLVRIYRTYISLFRRGNLPYGALHSIGKALELET